MEELSKVSTWAHHKHNFIFPFIHENDGNSLGSLRSMEIIVDLHDNMSSKQTWEQKAPSPREVPLFCSHVMQTTRRHSDGLSFNRLCPSFW